MFQSQNSGGVEAAPTVRKNILVGDHQMLATTATNTFCCRLENTSMKKYCSGLELSSNAMWRDIAPSL